MKHLTINQILSDNPNFKGHNLRRELRAVRFSDFPYTHEQIIIDEDRPGLAIYLWSDSLNQWILGQN